LLSVAFVGSTNAEEQINLNCTLYEGSDGTQAWKLTPEDKTLGIYPESMIMVYEGKIWNYFKEGNSIHSTNSYDYNGWHFKSKLTLDRKTGVFMTTLKQTLISTNKLNMYLSYIGLCKRESNLF